MGVRVCMHVCDASLLRTNKYGDHPFITAVDQKHWKKLTGRFSNIMVCPHACLTHHAPQGFSPYGHLGNGCTDIVLLSHCSKISHARWLMRQKKNRDMVRVSLLTHVHIQCHVYAADEAWYWPKCILRK